MTNYFAGHIILETEMSLHEVGTLLSARLFADIYFAECSVSRFDGVPSLELVNSLLGCEVILQKAIDNGDKKQILLNVSPPRALLTQMTDKKQINIDSYLRFWAREKLKDVPEVIVTDLR